MPLTKTEGLLLSNDELLRGLLENDERRLQLADRLPFIPIQGHELRVERASLADYGIDPIFDTVPVAVTEGVAKPAASLEAKFELKLLVQDVIVNDFTACDQSNVNSQVGVQLAAAARRMLYTFWRTFYAGDNAVNSQEFSGIRKLTPPGQTIQANDTVNNSLDLIDLARLESRVRSRSGRPDILFTSPVGERNIAKAYYEKGLQPEFVPQSFMDVSGELVTRPCMGFGGIPIVVDESVATNETVGTFSDGTSIYAFCLGSSGIYGIVPAMREGGNDAYGRMMRVKEVLKSATAQTTHRMYWPVGLALEREDAIARLQIRPMAGTV